MLLLHLLVRKVEFISELRPLLLMQPTSTVLVAGYSSLQFRYCISEGNNSIFGTMTSVWKLFYYSPHKPEVSKDIQAAFGFLELKIVKPSNIRCLSHERCEAICKELPPLLQTLLQLYESSGYAEAYGVHYLWASVNGVSSSYLQSEVHSGLALLNLFTQKMILDIKQAYLYAHDYT